MYKPFYLKLILAAVLLMTMFSSCTKDKEPDTSSPAYHINESEKLVLPAAIELPSNLPGGNTRVMTLYAEGVQKYKAQQKPGTGPVTYEWVFVAPQADLFDATNKKIGTHGAGPFWQLSAADSIFAQHFSPAKTSPSNEPLTIDWLLLMTRPDKTPTGFFVNVAYIQRIATRGGKAPSALPSGINETIDIPYTAVYRFTKRNP